MNLRRLNIRTTLRRFGCLLVAALVLCSAGARLRGQAAAAPDQLRTLSRNELDVVKVLTRQEDAWNKGDIDGFATAFKQSPDILFIGSTISHGYANMLADYKRDFPNKEAMGALSFSDLEPKLLDERFAVVVGHYRLERTKKAGGNAEGEFSLILEKTPDGWKIIVDHTTG